MDQTSDESKGRHRKEDRLDRENMLGCTWAMDQSLITCVTGEAVLTE